MNDSILETAIARRKGISEYPGLYVLRSEDQGNVASVKRRNFQFIRQSEFDYLYSKFEAVSSVDSLLFDSKINTNRYDLHESKLDYVLSERDLGSEASESKLESKLVLENIIALEPNLQPDPEPLSSESVPDVAAKPNDHEKATEEVPYQPISLPVGLVVGDRIIPDLILVRGQEDGSQAINLERWLLPFDKVVEALKLESKPLEDGKIELRGLGGTLQINPSELVSDPEIGPVLSIGDLQADLGIDAEFNVLEYSLILKADWLKEKPKVRGPSASNEPTISFDGLPLVNPPGLSLSAIQQRTFATQSENSFLVGGELQAVGTLFGSSWYLNLEQGNLGDLKSWGVKDAEIVRLTPKADFFIGTQQPFWPQPVGEGDLFGVTSVFRFGYKPSLAYGSEPDLDSRLETSQFKRTISGRAQPNTIAQLRARNGISILDEVLVDDSGIYRFTDVPLAARQSRASFRVYLFPEGRLTSTPEIRDVSINGALSGQLPAGATALTISAGSRRSFSSFGSASPLGSFDDFIGGISGLWGVSNSLTIGLGAAYDRGFRGFGEVLWQPRDLPVDASFSISTGGADTPLAFEGIIQARPTDSLNLRFLSDELSSRFDIDWQVTSGLNLSATVDTAQPDFLGLNYSQSLSKELSFSTGLSMDTDSVFRWRQQIYWKQFEFNSRLDNRGEIYSELAFNLSPDRYSAGHSIVATYDQSDGNGLGSLLWRYQSPQQSFFGEPLWETEFGFGLGSSGAGVLASVQTSILPGIAIQASYEGINLNGGSGNFSLNLVSSLETRNGFRPGSKRSFDLRTQGGILVEAFLDANQNGKLDLREKRYSDPNLILLNSKPIDSSALETSGQIVRLRKPPGTYRVDLDPAGLPLDWQATETSFAAKVHAGSFTPILVPLVPSYTASGIVTSSEGGPLGGARVTAVADGSGHRVSSITDGAGSYYLEGLKRETYALQVNGQPIEPATVRLNTDSQSYFELNLRQTDQHQQTASVGEQQEKDVSLGEVPQNQTAKNVVEELLPSAHDNAEILKPISATQTHYLTAEDFLDALDARGTSIDSLGIESLNLNTSEETISQTPQESEVNSDRITQPIAPESTEGIEQASDTHEGSTVSPDNLSKSDIPVIDQFQQDLSPDLNEVTDQASKLYESDVVSPDNLSKSEIPGFIINKQSHLIPEQESLAASIISILDETL